jgi:Glycosyl transferase family 2
MYNGAKAVTACIPYFRCRRYIRRAVESLLVQTHQNLSIVVVNDGDTAAPWEQLAHIRDNRLIRFDLRTNRGAYFATAVVLNATSAPYFLIQDADDWSAPQRVARLLEKLESDHADLAVSAIPIYVEGPGGHLKLRYTQPAFSLRPRSSPELTWRFNHVGLWRTGSLRRIGGYYGGFRMSYDMLLTNVISLTGRVSGVDTPLYCIHQRPDSLSRHPATALRSPARALVEKQLASMYQEVYQEKMRFLKQQIGSAELMERIRAICGRHIPAEARAALDSETESLSVVLQGR